MLPKNFPARKNTRRIRALERMKKTKNPSNNLKIAIENTEDKLRDDTRTIRTKKVRTKK